MSVMASDVYEAGYWVSGRRPAGALAPLMTDMTAGPPSWPGQLAHRIELTLSRPRMGVLSTWSPICTTTSGLPTAASFLMRSICAAGHAIDVRSDPAPAADVSRPPKYRT